MNKAKTLLARKLYTDIWNFQKSFGFDPPTIDEGWEQLLERLDEIDQKYRDTEVANLSKALCVAVGNYYSAESREK